MYSDDDAETVPCPYCGEQVYEEAERCPACGTYISEEDKPFRPKAWIAITACVLVALMLLGLFGGF